MNQSYLHSDGDQDSLFGSPPPSPARGRSPSQETFIAGGEIGPTIAVPSTGVGRKNVGTIALPGSHMSCAELPANPPASSLSPPRPTSSHDLSSIVPPSIVGTSPSLHTRSSTRSIPSRASSAASTIPSASSIRKRRPPKSTSLTPISPAPPIALPGPNEPTPPNFLRSQSSLLGLAGLVGCVKPAQLYTHGPQPTPLQQSRSHSPIRGSTPTHPIVLEDDQETPPIEKLPDGQLQMPQHLDQLDPEILRSNIMNSVTKEKNIFPVLESLIKLFGGEPHFPSANPLPQPFSRPYGHGIFNTQSSPIVSRSFPVSTPAAPPPKRRKLKHVPAGAADWDVPFPFAAGEGPEAYRDTWARDRAKQLVTQLLELIQNAAKRAAIKTAKNGGKASKGRTRARSCQSSRSASVETQIGQISSSQASIRESSLPYTSLNTEVAVTGTPTDSLSHYLGSLEAPSTVGSTSSGSNDRMSLDSEVAVEGGSVSCDYSAFEEWLSQLQQFVPLETNIATPESDWGARQSVPLCSSAASPAPEIHIPTQHTIRDEAIDPILLGISQQFGSAPQSQSPTLPTPSLPPGDISHVLDISPTPPPLLHSPRTSLSSLTEPLTPLSEVFADALTSTNAQQDLVRDPLTHQPAEKDYPSEPAIVSSATEPSEPPRINAARKGKARAVGSVISATPSVSSRSTPSVPSTSKGTLDKQAILERARERRRQLIAEIERAKLEIWETTLENAVLVHFTRDDA